MTPLTEHELLAWRFKKSFSIYEAGMLWNGWSPESDFFKMISLGKPASYYAVAQALVDAVQNKEMDPDKVRIWPKPWIGPDLETVINCDEPNERILTCSEHDYYEYEINVYLTLIKRKELARWALSKGLVPDFLKDDVKAEKEIPRGKSKQVEMPSGTKWENVALIVKDHSLIFCVGKKRKEIGFKEADFEDKRKGGVPNQPWILLKFIAKNNGVISGVSTDLPSKTRNNLKQYISQLRTKLCTLFQIKDNPIIHRENQYKVRFKISTEETRSLGIFPANMDSWDKISISEKEDGSIIVNAEESDKELECNLQDLNLINKEGDPTETGKAFLQLLRSGGRLSRDYTDKAMIDLSTKLNDVFGIENFPFEVDTDTGTWKAKFEASSERIPASPQ